MRHLFLLLPLVVGTTLDKCCPKAKVGGVSYGLSYENNTNGLAKSCESSCPYLLEGAENGSDVRCFDTINNEDLCVFPKIQTRKRNKLIPIDSVSPRRQTRNRAKTMICGWVYEHKDYYGCRGYTRESAAGYTGNFIRFFNDKVSSVRVTDGCKMHLFEHPNLQGRSRTFTGNTAWVDWNWNDLFSSYICTCEHHELDVEFLKRKCRLSSMRHSCKLYQLTDLSWNTAEELHARAQKYKNKRRGIRKGWEYSISDQGTYQAGYVKAAVSADWFRITFLTRYGIFHINSAKNAKPIEQIDWTLFGVESKQTVSWTYLSSVHKLVLTGGSVSIFDLQIAIGISEQVGYDEEKHSVKVRYLGTGVTLGGETGICVVDSCFSINFNKLFG